MTNVHRRLVAFDRKPLVLTIFGAYPGPADDIVHSRGLAHLGGVHMRFTSHSTARRTGDRSTFIWRFCTYIINNGRETCLVPPDSRLPVLVLDGHISLSTRNNLHLCHDLESFFCTSASFTARNPNGSCGVRENLAVEGRSCRCRGPDGGRYRG